MAVTLPESDIALVDAYCKGAVPERVLDQLRVEYRTRGSTVTIVECRPMWSEEPNAEWVEQEVARMKYDAESERWTLYWFDRNSKAHRYEQLEPYRPIQRLLDEIEKDPTAIFWG